MRKEFLIIASVVLAGILVWLAVVLLPENENLSTIPVLGPEGSEHSHARLLVVVFDELTDFSKPEYMLKNPLVHFEDADGTIIHKHATGVTLPFFFSTLEMELNSNCLVSVDQTRFCTDEQNSLSIFVNRTLFNDRIANYELTAGDQNLI